jgi:hypothetical protein
MELDKDIETISLVYMQTANVGPWRLTHLKDSEAQKWNAVTLRPLGLTTIFGYLSGRVVEVGTMHLVGAKPQAHAGILSGYCSYEFKLSTASLSFYLVYAKRLPSFNDGRQYFKGSPAFDIYLANFKVYIMDAEHIN